jgi:hypothetical protein
MERGIKHLYFETRAGAEITHFGMGILLTGGLTKDSVNKIHAMQ